jgi:hypothetical protein
LLFFLFPLLGTQICHKRKRLPKKQTKGIASIAMQKLKINITFVYCSENKCKEHKKVIFNAILKKEISIGGESNYSYPKGCKQSYLQKI